MLERQENLSELAGKKVIDWDPDLGLLDPAQTIYRIRVEYDGPETWVERFAVFLQDSAVSELTGLVVGMWSTEVMETEEAIEVVEALVAACEKLPKLQTLFLGDIIAEENEVSWIEQTDVSSLFEAYPRLEYFGIRGGNNLRLGSIQHEHLRTLVVEAGGLPREVVHDIQRADLPALEHLEIWLGTPDYGGDTTIEDFAPLLRKQLFPRLRYLGLRNSAIADQVASVFAYAPIMDYIEIFDLSLGTLTDMGAEALLHSPAVLKLKKLDLHHHYCSEEMVKKLEQLGINVDVSESQEILERSWGNTLYVSLGE